MGNRVRVAWLFLAPMLLVLGLVAAWPLARTVWFSLTDANLLRLGEARFVGFENYLDYSDGRWYGVLADPLWWTAVRNTLWFAAISVGLETIIGFAVALVLHATFPGRGL